jgi:superfamily II DNA/RNA helicase
MLFSEMNLDPVILQGLKDMGIVNPTDIQTQSIPMMLNSNDAHIMGQAKTGTGKTLAFAIPIIQMIDCKMKAVQAVVLVPTRELCKQVSEVFANLAKYKQIKVVEVYGGVSINRQIQEIYNGGQIVIATPGRLIDIYKQGKIKLNSVKFVTLDEADRMLDMGFFPDIEYIMLKAMRGIQPRMMLYSATLADQIKTLARRFTQGKELIEINVSKDDMTVADCEQYYYIIRDADKKYAHFIEIINENKPRDMIIFVRTKHFAEKLYRNIRSEKQINKDIFFKAGMLHGDLSQSKREFIMRQFKDQEINCLIATNVAARGLDFTQVSHIFNYDFPDASDACDEYVHRIGRTARVDSKNNGLTTKGIAISLVLKNQLSVLKDIEKHINRTLVNKPLPEIKDVNDYNCPQYRSSRSVNRGIRTSDGEGSNNPGGSRGPRGPRGSNGSERSDRSGRSGKSKRLGKPKRFNNANQPKSSRTPKTSNRVKYSAAKKKTQNPVEEKVTTKIYPIK